MSWHSEQTEQEKISGNSERKSIIPRFRPGKTESIGASKESLLSVANDALEKNEVKGKRLDARRFVSEAVAQKAIGEDTINLDVFCKEKILGVKGNNYPFFDIMSSKEIASVKTHWDANCGLGEREISKYIQEFGELLGCRAEYKIEDDVKNVIKLREAGASIPQELVSANDQVISKYLRENSILRIPDDHVEKIRDIIRNEIKDLPGRYYLPENPSESQINQITNRIRPIGLTSIEMEEIIRKFV